MPDSRNLTRVSPLLPHGDTIVNYKTVRLQERISLTSIQILSFKGQYKKAAKAITKSLGIDCPTTPGQCASDAHTQIIWVSPISWMIVASDADAGRSTDQLLENLQQAVGKLAAVVDQSHGRCGLRLSGENARKVMAKNTAIDLHPRSFGSGQCAQTSVAHMNASLVQVDDKPTYDLFVARSLARSFTHAIEHACAEFASD
ncbi:MAG: heterotetrameric sarcosine oxidase gamma subunit [Planctomycetota bacterium]